MSPSRIPWRFLILLLITSLVFPAASARAQEAGAVSVFPPETTKFPTITTLLDTFDDQGQYLLGLTPQNVTVLENGQEITPDAVQASNPPLSVVVAINSGPILGVRDGFGVSRYDKAVAVISNWAGARPAENPDDVSLAWNGGILASHLAPAQWKIRFDAFDSDPRVSQPSLAALSFALDAALEAKSVPGGKKAILLVSGHLDNESAAGLSDISARAQQAGIRVFVWLVDSESFLTHSGALALQTLAESTGGRYLTFTGSETLPDPEEWFSPLRHIYQLTYTSKIRAGGQHSLLVQINANGLALTTPPVNFQLNVEPPSVALLSPPVQIIRQNPAKPFDIESFTPVDQPISVLVEFPDGFQRALKRVTLLVDDQKVAENTSEPFKKFTWDLSAYIASDNHTLQVEVEDVLGMSRLSASIPVRVTVIQPPGGVTGFVLQNSSAVTIGFIVLAGVVLLGILILGGRSFVTLAERRRARNRNLDPVTQPIHTSAEPKKDAPRANPFPWLRRKAPPPPAYFVPLTPDGLPARGDPIPLTGREMTFGTDPTQATNVLDHLSVSPLHARLRLTDEGAFLFMDQNSIAGTWVNYESISNEGRFLKHGDMVNFGQFMYRFVLGKPPAASKPTIINL